MHSRKVCSRAVIALGALVVTFALAAPLVLFLALRPAEPIGEAFRTLPGGATWNGAFHCPLFANASHQFDPTEPSDPIQNAS